jgi:hypothetical protein
VKPSPASTSRARVEPVAAELLEARLRLAEALHQRLELARARRVRERVLERVQRARRLRDRAGAVERRLDHAPALHLADVLAEVADHDAAIDGDLPGVRLLLADQQPEDRGLPGAVGPDQPDPLPALDRGGGVQEQDLAAVALPESVDADHGQRV